GTGILGKVNSLIVAKPKQLVCCTVSLRKIICTGIIHALNNVSLPRICQFFEPQTLFKSTVLNQYSYPSTE
ncbi:hypothetical protein NDU88_001955, partial [Pleurodeles waltl]